PAELPGVERERLVLVVHPQLCIAELDHLGPPGSTEWSPVKLVTRRAVVFSKRAALRAPVHAQDTRRDLRLVGRRRERRAVGGRRDAVAAGEAGGGRADAAQADRD